MADPIIVPAAMVLAVAVSLEEEAVGCTAAAGLELNMALMACVLLRNSSFDVFTSTTECLHRDRIASFWLRLGSFSSITES